MSGIPSGIPARKAECPSKNGNFFGNFAYVMHNSKLIQYAVQHVSVTRIWQQGSNQIPNPTMNSIVPPKAFYIGLFSLGRGPCLGALTESDTNVMAKTMDITFLDSTIHGSHRARPSIEWEDHWECPDCGPTRDMSECRMGRP